MQVEDGDEGVLNVGEAVEVWRQALDVLVAVCGLLLLPWVSSPVESARMCGVGCGAASAVGVEVSRKGWDESSKRRLPS